MDGGRGRNSCLKKRARTTLDEVGGILRRKKWKKEKRRKERNMAREGVADRCQNSKKKKKKTPKR